MDSPWAVGPLPLEVIVLTDVRTLLLERPWGQIQSKSFFFWKRYWGPGTKKLTLSYFVSGRAGSKRKGSWHLIQCSFLYSSNFYQKMSQEGFNSDFSPSALKYHMLYVFPNTFEIVASNLICCFFLPKAVTLWSIKSLKVVKGLIKYP